MTLMADILKKRFHIRTKGWPLEGWHVAGGSDDRITAERVFRGLESHPAVREIELVDTWIQGVPHEKKVLLRGKK